MSSSEGSGNEVGDDQKLRVSGLWEILKRYDTYVGAVNFRCGLIASFSAAVFGTVILKAEKLLDGIGALHAVQSVLLLIVSLLALVSIYFVIKTIYPDLRSNLDKTNKHSLIFFKSVADNYKSSDYVAAIQSLSVDELERDLAIQIHEVAIITADKFKNIANAALTIKVMLCFLAGVLLVEVVGLSGVRLCFP